MTKGVWTREPGSGDNGLAPGDEIEALAKRHLLQPWESLEHLGQAARTVVDRAENIYLYDSEGNKLIDAPAGMWGVQVGYGWPVRRCSSPTTRPGTRPLVRQPNWRRELPTRRRET